MNQYHDMLRNGNSIFQLDPLDPLEAMRPVVARRTQPDITCDVGLVVMRETVIKSLR